MGKEKKKEAEVAAWKKAVVVGACVLFVILMIVSGMGSGWLTMFSAVKPGQVAVLDYTIYDSSGNPVITSNEQVYKKTVAQGRSVLAAKQIAIVANQSLASAVYPVQVFSTESGATAEFAIFATEYNAISSAVTGMKKDEQKKVTLPASSSMSQFWSAEQLAKSNISIANVNVGDVFAMGVSDNPSEMAANTSAKSYLRSAEVTRKTSEGIVVDFSYPSADIYVVQFGTGN